VVTKTPERRRVRIAEEAKMDDRMLARIQGDPNYKALVRERTSFGWTLAIITLVMYFGYIAIVAFAPSLIGTKVSGVITVGLIMGAALILLSVLLTGIYVMRANSRYDELTRAILSAATGVTR
jgi:uncharacterized membrane protein (DUF485 family)